MELIKVTNENGVSLVSGRELHRFLESKQDFTTWTRNRIEKYGFEENVDFTLHKFMEGKNWKHDYILKLDMAKELSMVENNDKGRQARKYFIECEKQLIQIKQDSYMIADPIARAKAWIIEEEERQALRIEVKEKQGIIEAQGVKIKNLFQQIEDLVERGQNTTFDIGTAAKLLNYKGLGKVKMFDLLRKRGVLCKNNDPMQKWIDNKYMILVSKSNPYTDDMYNQTRVTVKGLFALGRTLSKWGYTSNISEQELIEDIRNLVG